METAEDFWQQGYEFLEQGDFVAAIASYDRAIEIKSDDHETWNNRGNALDDLGRNEEAIASYDRAIEIKPDYHEAWGNRGVALSNLNRKKEAIASYDRAIKIKPDYDTAWYNRGAALDELGMYDEAIASYDRAIKIKPEKDEAWLNRGVALNDLGRYEEAIASYNKALEIKPDYDSAWFNWQVLAENRLVDFGHWLKVREIFRAGLQKISFEKEPHRHLVIWQRYISVCYRTMPPAEVQKLIENPSASAQRLVAETSMTEWQERRIREKFASFFQQTQVATLAQIGKLEEALELAEKQRNSRLGYLIEGQGYRPTAPSYQEAQQLLNSSTAIVYWHYSPVGLTTFILKHGQPLKILPPPVSELPKETNPRMQGDQNILHQVQAWETWLKEWKATYRSYQTADQTHPWRTGMKLQLENRNKGAVSLKSILNIQPLIDDHLKDVKNLILIPHRDLHLLPLHFLFPFKFTTTYLPSLQVGLNLHRQTPQPATKPLLNLHQPGNTYINITKDLITQFTGAEDHNLPTLNQAQFLELLGQNHSGLQFTGHGSHDLESPENSCLSLLKGDLRLTDLLHQKYLNLSSYRLICLTACESGITNNQSLLDEYIGWNSAFLAKQARAVISTLWNVNTRSSAFLMIRFYQLFSDPAQPLPVPEALRRAQFWLSSQEYTDMGDWCDEVAELLNPSDRDYLRTEAANFRDKGATIDSPDLAQHRPFTNPYHWAGFICTGLFSG